ncbi:MAG: hypothetical protein A2428_05650 [Bdellovibrionales bacterium RIFOXYC1_FULL_54_43]|nr:MAG: hypothetical protein A2428_05650 [Bdellovibrionales bacterium RIFOXYC1_FULL_54_43]OFZ85523.1 MAG: hypothetical protein A2603_16985 [Bdellovibrionales bacterium RIFOXYD1_FULL_55_31]
MIFKDRWSAGRLLSEKLALRFEKIDGLYFLPRGGIEIALPIAQNFRCPIVPVFVAKVRHPWEPEYAIGAMDEGGSVHVSEKNRHFVPAEELEFSIAQAARNVENQKRVYAGLSPVLPEEGTFILVDDGLATGESCKAALKFLRARHPAGTGTLGLGVPCASTSGISNVRRECDAIITVDTPDPDFMAVGNYYENFRQVEQDTVVRILHDYNEPFIRRVLKPAQSL